MIEQSAINEITGSYDTQYNPGTERFRGATWFEFASEQNIMLAGVGGIGSWLAFMLSRINPQSITIIDDDSVDASNMAGQLFAIDDVGKPKVSAVQGLMEKYSRYSRTTGLAQRFAYNSNPVPIMLCGFDNMSARRVYFSKWCDLVKATPEAERKDMLFIDGRLSAETLQIFCMSGNDEYYIREYNDKWLFSDSEAESTVCSYKQTSYCANLIASLMTNLFINWCANHCNPLIDRSLPFFTEYSGEFMYLKTEA